MLTRAKLVDNLHRVTHDKFDEAAIALFEFQYRNNITYKRWIDNLRIDYAGINVAREIPCLPIGAFRNHMVASNAGPAPLQFVSSGTTSTVPSIHHVYDLELYLTNAVSLFEDFYGPVADYCFLALLPNYLERTGSSLVAMVDHMITLSMHGDSGFYLYDHDRLRETLLRCRDHSTPTVLFGVSYALLDFIDRGAIDFPDLIIIETGGMKGNRPELTKSRLQSIISAGFNVSSVHSEYGMTELFSQAYSSEDGLFRCGKSMQVYTSDITDPLSDSMDGSVGVIRIIDLANIDSCAFIETQDIGRIHSDGRFELQGRLDVADLRGCNLMVSDL